MKQASSQTGSMFSETAPKLSQTVSTQASEWMVRLQEPDADEASRQAFQAWHDAHPDHAAAWSQVARFTAYLQDINTPLLKQTLMAQSRKDEAAAQRGAGRRRAIKTVGLAAFALGASGLTVRETGWWKRARADHATDTGEQRTITLADGTQVLLNTRTAIDVAYSGSQRLLRLMHGEIRVTTGQALDERPFLVRTRDGLLQPLGTRFTVRLQEDGTRVGVLEGAVRIMPQDKPAGMRVVSAGQTAYFTRMQAGAPEALDPAEAAWTNGVLIVHDMPLPQFLNELGRYQRGWLRCDSSAEGLLVSGIYPVTDVDRVLRSLEQNLPVRVRRRTPFWVTVGAADA